MFQAYRKLDTFDDDRAPHNVFVTTTTKASVPRLRGARAQEAKNGYPIGGVLYRFIQVQPERFFGTEKTWVGEARVTITDPERTLLDGLSIPQYCGDFSVILHAFEIRDGKLHLDRIINYALCLDVTTARRLGWVLEKQGRAPAQLESLRQAPIKGYGKLDPTGPTQGTLRFPMDDPRELAGKAQTMRPLRLRLEEARKRLRIPLDALV